MAERKCINLIFRYSDNWTGGTYYILNIIKSLKLLDDAQQPAIQVLHDKDSPIQAIKDINYPYLSFKVVKLHVSLFEKAVNKFFYLLNGYRPFMVKLPSDIKANVYPLFTDIMDSNMRNAYYWIPDFQEHYYPEFFDKYEIRARTSMYDDVLKRNSNIVFSSMNALEDYNRFFPSNRNTKKVLNFASFINDSYKTINATALLNKFGITKPFFIVPNQFWKHKNHKTVLAASALLKELCSDFQIVFTGKEFDYRYPDYAEQLKSYVKENNLNNMLFLGFIDREEQLKLMAESVAIIQPSLFEGWSTVVEDSKVVNQKIIISDIPLHREQIKENCIFFDPLNPADLADKIKDTLKSTTIAEAIDYQAVQRKFADDFIHLFDEKTV